jgi:hypothetical protein
VGCSNPPPGAQFYPIFTTTTGLNAGLGGDGQGGGGDNNNQHGNNNNNNNSSCVWQFGGPFSPGTANTFGGTSAAEYSTVLLPLAYPRPGGPVSLFNNYRRVLNNNPCPAPRGAGGDN